MTPTDLDPAKVGRDDDDPTSPSPSESGDDWDDGTPLTETMDQERVDKIDSIMQSFCAALQSKLVLAKQEKPSPVAIKREEDDGSETRAQEDQVKREEDVEEEDKPDTKKESKTPTPNLKGIKALPLLLKKSVSKEKSVETSKVARAPPPAAPLLAPSTLRVARSPRPRAAFRLAPRQASPAATEAQAVAEVSIPAPPAPAAPVASSSVPPPPPPPAPTPTRDSATSRGSTGPVSTSLPVLPSSAPVPPPQPLARRSASGAPGGGGPPPALPTILPSNAHLIHNQFFHVPSLPPVSSSQSPPGLGIGAQNLQQAAARLPGGVFQSFGEQPTFRPPPSPGAQFRRLFSSSRTPASHEQTSRAAEPSFGGGPPSLQWQPPSMIGAIGLFNQPPFGGPQVGSRGLDQEQMLSPEFSAPFPGHSPFPAQSPFDPSHGHFPSETPQPPTAASPPGDPYLAFPEPVPGGSRRRYQFGTSPDLGQQDNDGFPSRKLSAVSPLVGPSSSPAAAAAQPIVDKASDRDGRRKRQKAADAATPKNSEKKFACPYYKRNKKKYSKWTSCPGPGWEEVHRVKTHLYRRHGRPPQCPRCWAIFTKDEDLQAHQQENPPCETSQNMSLVEGFSKEQEKKLRSRKKAQPNMTDEDKWRDIYMILFPDDDKDSIPSPYYDDNDDADREGGGNAESPGAELEDYADFVRREMPTLVRRELEILFENEFNDIDEKLKPRVAKIVLELQPKLLSLYKQSQLPLSEYGPQVPGQDALGHTPASNSEPGMASTVSPASAIESNPTPGVMDGNLNDGGHVPGHVPYYDPTTLGFDINNMGSIFVWDENQYQVPAPATDTAQYQGIPANNGLGLQGGDGLDWNFEFDQLLNPALLVQPSAELLTQGQGQGTANEWGKRKYEGN